MPRTGMTTETAGAFKGPVFQTATLLFSVVCVCIESFMNVCVSWVVDFFYSTRESLPKKLCGLFAKGLKKRS
jgi:hypothetical protein